MNILFPCFKYITPAFVKYLSLELKQLYLKLSTIYHQIPPLSLTWLFLNAHTWVSPKLTVIRGSKCNHDWLSNTTTSWPYLINACNLPTMRQNTSSLTLSPLWSLMQTTSATVHLCVNLDLRWIVLVLQGSDFSKKSLIKTNQWFTLYIDNLWNQLMS